jgi:hypothetical protein
LTAAAAQLERLPRQFGNWKLAEELPLEVSAVQMLQCAGYVNRRYVNQQSGQTVNLAIIVGPAGPTAVHTPEICFSSRAWKLQGERHRIALEASPTKKHTFWTVDFSAKNALADDLRVYYSWSRGSTWEASASPRYEFAAEPMLYKLQLAGPIGPSASDEDRDSCREFLDELLKTSWTTAASG